ncbi:glucan phosphoethanolaminetransferase (alkaline phosphatase superfamily) [Paraburkholderia caribensis]|nr:glucan phosphoethanolaminetransferase (alkaline phosphatase superfamily) [Paraburkholderia caribensis]
MSSMPHRLFRLLTVVWVGSLLTIGYAVAPVLFTSLDRVTAGAVAAQLFRIEGVIGVVCGVLLLALCNLLVRRGGDAYRRLRWLIAGMLVCVLVGYFALQPFMNALRIAAQEAGTDVGHSVYASRFGMLHGVSSVFYLIESLLGIVLVWKLPAESGIAVERGAGRVAGRTAG